MAVTHRHIHCHIPVTCDSVTHNIIHDTNLWDGDHHMISLSSCDMHLEADAKVLAISLRYLAYFI